MLVVKRGQMLVAKEDEVLKCGTLVINKGKICKADTGRLDHWGKVRVFKSKKREEMNTPNSVSISILRPATEEEAKEWN